MNTLKLQRFETCDYAMTAQDGKLSLVGLFDRIFVQNLPAQHPSMSFVVVAEGAPKSEHKIKFVIKNPSGKVLNEIVMQVKSNDAGYFNIIGNLNNLPITEQGVLTIECFDGDTKLGLKEVIISKVPQNLASKAKN